MDWIDMVEDRDRWWPLVNAVMNLWVPSNAGNLSNGTSHEGCYHMGLVKLCSAILTE